MAVLLDVLLGALEDDFTLLLIGIALLLSISSPEFSLLLLRFALLEKCLRNEKIVLGGNGPITRRMLE